MGRLERLLVEPVQPGRDSCQRIDLDDAVEPHVVAHRAQGGRIVHHRGNLQAFAPADDVAKALNVLLSNVRDHAPGATVRISSELSDGEVALIVTDDGPGIPDEVRLRMFRRHAKGLSSSGQGIGLSYARQILRACGGELELQSSADGTVFRICLPS
nr:sensor histidine kinase [Nocardioides daedukensis]